MNAFDWKPSIDFKSGLEDTIKWYVENEWWWSEILETKYHMDRQGNK